ncbi:16S rRNA (guanine(966)-N(2))-methyltransferase RsmD [Parahaliea aestuarii]|uniref:Ribosomal RNA small subunit methyltransferase D n=1 Tax=Parahaliea aestuarii TaxID=1852021 RepID=A0A5C8ZXV9_9GAMM|nr:16S rRNA (guanine(966)-N(2))-methyltransferase RsmD [Parahaliea aestuarii]TXS92432.1 16S rRNA (guanine(966)-N(2))-methyltransferase RsmD [Parahaliea aestuarii]
MSPPPKPRHTATSGTAQLRIIGGHWRGRKLSFLPADGLRPTADRVRETLFNWLAPVIRDARCLDLFSGSGALGLEALSRGAAHCAFVDTNGANLRQISKHLDTLDAADRGACHNRTAEEFLNGNREPWDIVFLDPPFERGLAAPALTLLADGHLAPEAMVYLECGRQEMLPAVPDSWDLHRDKTAGNVRYLLYHTP